MATTKATFTIDEATERSLRESAERLGISKSEVVREAVKEYAARAGRLTEAERLRLLSTFDEVVPRIPERPELDVDRELAEIRAARRGGGRWSPHR